MTFYKGDATECVNCKMGKNGDASCEAGKLHSEGNYACFNGRPIDNKPAKGRSKYGNVRCEYLGESFDSQFERDYFKELKLLEGIGEISDLQVHPKFYFEHNGIKMGHYEGDFQFIEDGKLAVIDCKGVKTSVYQLKKKMMKAFWNIEIREVYKK